MGRKPWFVVTMAVSVALVVGAVGAATALLQAADEPAPGAAGAPAGGGESVALPKAVTEGGKPLMEALAARRSSREFDERALPPQVLANLLWAASGVSRPDGRRTAPSALNWQEVEVYLATADGVFAYDPPAHALKRVLAVDVRALTGQQEFVKTAPLNLVYVADLARMQTTRFPVKDEDRGTWAAVSAGAMVQNVYLFCASEGLNAVVRALLPREELAAKLGLRPDQRILVAQTVGYPKP